MDWLSGISGLLQEYVAPGGGTASARSDVHDHFEQVAGAAPKTVVADGISEAMRSHPNVPFPQMVADLFSRSNSEQRAGLLNRLIASLGPGFLTQILPPNLAGVLSGREPVSPEHADRISPDQVQQIAERAQEKDPGVIDAVGRFYSQHPDLVKTMGAAALTIAMAKMAERVR